MVNIKNELENYPLIDIKSLEEKNPDIPDNIRNSIILYNKALESLRTGSEDIAVIELKKAVSMNPSFYEAMNLLGLSYMVTKDKAKAEEMFNKVAEAENNGIRATQYLKSVNGEDAPSGIQAKVKKRETQAKPARPKTSDFQRNVLEANYKKDLFKYLLAFAVGAVVMFLICLPVIFGKGSAAAKLPGGNSEVSQLRTSLADTEKALNDLKENYNNAKKELDTANKDLDYYKFAIKLTDVSKLISQKKYTEAADMLLLMKTADFKGTEKGTFDSLWSQCIPKAADIAYNEGHGLFNSKKYEEAIKKFDKVKLYNDKFDRMDGLLYYEGKSYQGLKDSHNALASYQQLIQNYPKSRYFKYAEYKIKELTQNP